MLPAIQLKNQLPWRTIKIHNIITNVFLPVKLISLNLFPANFWPKQFFRIGHIFSERSGTRLQVFIKWQQNKNPSQPPFRKGRGVLLPCTSLLFWRICVLASSIYPRHVSVFCAGPQLLYYSFHSTFFQILFMDLELPLERQHVQSVFCAPPRW